LPADGADETFEGGEERTTLGADVSELTAEIESSGVESTQQEDGTSAETSDTAEDSDIGGIFSRWEWAFLLLIVLAGSVPQLDSGVAAALGSVMGGALFGTILILLKRGIITLGRRASEFVRG
jgi:hypothetical protein